MLLPTNTVRLGKIRERCGTCIEDCHGTLKVNLRNFSTDASMVKSTQDSLRADIQKAVNGSAGPSGEHHTDIKTDRGPAGADPLSFLVPSKGG